MIWYVDVVCSKNPFWTDLKQWKINEISTFWFLYENVRYWWIVEVECLKLWIEKIEGRIGITKPIKNNTWSDFCYNYRIYFISEPKFQINNSYKLTWYFMKTTKKYILYFHNFELLSVIFYFDLKHDPQSTMHNNLH